MEKIKNQSHSKETLFYGLSIFFERTAYFGIRAILILYIFDKFPGFSQTQIQSIYGLFIGSFIISQLIGALLGDLVLGNKKAIITGGFIQTAGILSLCIPGITGLYAGLFLVVAGNGLYKPNLISNFGKTYLIKPKLLDSGFTLFYFIVNAGATIGAFIVGIAGESTGWITGFVLAGILMLTSVIFAFFTKVEKQEYTEIKLGSFVERSIKILVALLLAGLFWSVYQITTFRVVQIQNSFHEISTLFNSIMIRDFLTTGIIIILSLIASVIWTFLYSSQFFKLLTGFISGTIALGLYFFIPQVAEEQHVSIFLLSLVLMGISEVHIAPVIHSVLTKYSNPRYLAILISLSYVPTKLLSLFFGLFNEKFAGHPEYGVYTALVIMVAGSILLLLFYRVKKRNSNRYADLNNN
ncbi:MFS transporter [Saccharicrinis sp. FJH54]|uniref:MFS transporter n=1 Tax=Saccharicrinis sp. FJH54 TaxID=3344665 RepID=UPI0035D46B79